MLKCSIVYFKYTSLIEILRSKGRYSLSHFDTSIQTKNWNDRIRILSFEQFDLVHSLFASRFSPQQKVKQEEKFQTIFRYSSIREKFSININIFSSINQCTVKSFNILLHNIDYIELIKKNFMEDLKMGSIVRRFCFAISSSKIRLTC